MKLFKYLGRFVLLILFLHLFIAVSLFIRPLQPIAGFFYQAMYKPMQMAIEYEVTPLVYIVSLTPLKDRHYTYAKSIHCDTPLTLAAKHGSIASVDILLDAGASHDGCFISDIMRTQGHILFIALRHPELLKHLVENRGILEENPVYKDNGLWWTVTGRCNADTPELMRLFLEHGANPNLTRHEKFVDTDMSVLAKAYKEGCILAISVLLEYGADQAEGKRMYAAYIHNYNIRFNAPDALGHASPEKR